VREQSTALFFQKILPRLLSQAASGNIRLLGRHPAPKPAYGFALRSLSKLPEPQTPTLGPGALVRYAQARGEATLPREVTAKRTAGAQAIDHRDRVDPRPLALASIWPCVSGSSLRAPADAKPGPRAARTTIRCE
jgi:hypothetical protein